MAEISPTRLRAVLRAVHQPGEQPKFGTNASPPRSGRGPCRATRSARRPRGPRRPAGAAGAADCPGVRRIPPPRVRRRRARPAAARCCELRVEAIAARVGRVDPLRGRQPLHGAAHRARPRLPAVDRARVVRMNRCRPAKAFGMPRRERRRHRRRARETSSARASGAPFPSRAQSNANSSTRKPGHRLALLAQAFDDARVAPAGRVVDATRVSCRTCAACRAGAARYAPSSG